jgi:tetratricopeptide (TPR) repeat protein
MANNNVTETTVEHFAFFEALGAIVDRTERSGLKPEEAESLPEYRIVLAGILTLRLVDGWVAAVAEGGSAPSLKHIASARRSVRACEVGPVRNALDALVSAMLNSWGVASPAIGAQAFAYARLLQDESAWAIAADAYLSVVACAQAANDTGLLPLAFLHMGGCFRTCGRLADADRAYARAGETATAAGDTYHALLSRVGAANAVANRGNLPRAEALLDAIVRETEALVPGAPALIEVLARAKHDRGVVVVDRGDPARATDDFFEAFEAYTEPRRRTRALVDLANALTALGAHTAARDALHLSLAATTDREVRLIVSINLLELAQMDGEETTFERWRRDLADTDLPPRLRAYFLLYSGYGLYRFGRADGARTALAGALVIAERCELGEVVMRADAALAAIDRNERLPVAGASAPSAPGVARIVDRLRVMRARQPTTA